MLSRLKGAIFKHAPLPVLRTACSIAGSFRAQEKLGLIMPPWYGYGVLEAATQARAQGLSEIYALEFGVANGRGLRHLKKIGAAVTQELGVTVHIAGFDSGCGMPPIVDYRDHPEKYREGDYPLQDYEKLASDLGSDVRLVIGDIANTVPQFLPEIDAKSPIGFVAVDVDIYSSTKSALRIFDGKPEQYLPFTFTYFDDCHGSTHYNRFCGELLALDEFNSGHKMRKIDIDRSVWNKHRQLGPQMWYERSYITHIFDHPWRFEPTTRAAKILPTQ